MRPYETRIQAEAYDILAPDQSEIRLLATTEHGSMVHCTLQSGQISLAITHRTVAELWYVVGGTDEIWRKQDDHEEITPLQAGTSLSIPAGTHFQFRCTGDTALELVLVTMPPWPGDGEAVRVPDHWPGDA